MRALSAYISMDRRQALSKGEALPDRSNGTALFADISGFTPLTAALADELGRQRGAEEMLHQIDAIFEVLIASLHQYRGSAISFAGDAITCWFDGDDGRRAVACALAMQERMQPFHKVVTPAGTTISLGIKIAVAAGPVRRFVVGDPTIQLIDVLAGATLDNMAAAEKQAERGEIVVTEKVVEQLDGTLKVGEWRTDEKTKASFARMHSLNQAVEPEPWRELPEGVLTAEQVKPWVLPPVITRLEAGDSFLAELRPAAPLFLRFGGIDYDQDDSAGEKLDAYIRWVQSVLGRYDGYLFQISMGDKGSYLYTAFGAPVAHDDDPARAVAAALGLLDLPGEFSFINLVHVGVSRGRVWSGAYGSSTRHTYGVIGDETNIAARLMAKAQPGQALVSKHVASEAHRGFEYKDLGAIKVKGRQAPLPVSELVQKREAAQQPLSTLYTHPLVGREDVLEEMQEKLVAAKQGRGQILRIEGVAGIGKSHLTAMFSRSAQEQGFETLTGVCQSVTQGTPYTPWRQILRAAFGLTAEGDDLTYPSRELHQQAEIKAVQDHITASNPAWLARLPLLGGVLGLPIPDNAVTAAMDPSLRQEALFSLVTEILQARAQGHPLLIVLEDVDWMDEASQELTLAVGRSISRTRVLMLVVQRPPIDPDRPYLPGLNQLAYQRKIDLNELTPAGIGALAQNRVGGTLSPVALALIQEKAQGNPFYAEELVDTLLEGEKLLPDSKGAWGLGPDLMAALEHAGVLERDRETGEERLTASERLTAVDLGIPDTVHGLVLSRIDRLPEIHKLTLKVASVIGRTFDIGLLSAVHPGVRDASTLIAQIETMMTRDLVRREIVGYEGGDMQITYMFKHNITQEVAYETLLFAQRRQLHQAVAVWHERTYGNLQIEPGDGAALDQLSLDSPLAPYYGLLAHHWHYAENEPRERVYAGLAGKQAAAQHANEDAVRYLSRALELTPGDDWEKHYDLVLSREAVFDWLGRREAQAGDLSALETLADRLDDPVKCAKASLRLANYERSVGKYEAALVAAEQGIEQASQTRDATLRAEGHYTRAQILRQQGDYEQAQKHLRHAIKFARLCENKKIEADGLLQVGNIHFHTGDFESATDYYRQALPFYQSISDRKGETGCLMMLGVIHTHAGEYLTGQEYHKRALEIAHSIGYQYGETFILGNLGVNYVDVGEFEKARDTLEASIEISEDIGDLEGKGIGLGNLANIENSLGNFKLAIANCKMALTLQDELGDRRNKGFTLTCMGNALVNLGKYQVAIAAFEEAIAIRRELGEDSLIADDLAGLAWAFFLAGDQEQSLKYVDEALGWIEENGIEGIEYPLQVYWTCYQVLDTIARDDAMVERGKKVLESACALLQKQVEAIRDEEIRRKFLENIPYNREVHRACQAHL